MSVCCKPCVLAGYKTPRACARGVLLPAPCALCGAHGAGLGLQDTGCGNRSAACPVSGWCDVVALVFTLFVLRSRRIDTSCFGHGCGRYASALRIYWARGAACALAIGRGSCGDRCARNALPVHKLSCTESTRPVCRSMLGTGALFVLSDGVSRLVPLISRILLCTLAAPRAYFEISKQGARGCPVPPRAFVGFSTVPKANKKRPACLVWQTGRGFIEKVCPWIFRNPPAAKSESRGHAIAKQPRNACLGLAT